MFAVSESCLNSLVGGLIPTPTALREVRLLEELCGIDSQSMNRPGVQRAQQWVADFLSKLGFAVSMTSGDGRFADLLVAERAGRSSQFITLITHTDTVLPNWSPLRISGDARAYGSGVIDDKGGVVVGLSALQMLLGQENGAAYSLRFVCSPNEEVGSIGFTDKYRELARDTAIALGLEPALDSGNIIHQRRGNRWYDIDIEGQEAHAGRSKGGHANAAHVMAEKIHALARLNEPDEDVSVNVGHVRAGRDLHNVVCGHAHIKLDTRFPSAATRNRLHQEIDRILQTPADAYACGHVPARVRYAIADDCPPFSLTERSRRIAEFVAFAISEVEGRLVVSQPSGGAGDVNYLSTDRNLVLDGLGPVGGLMHTEGEFLYVNTLRTRASALAQLLRYLQFHNLDFPATPLPDTQREHK
jgi:glutamate carboxypeptidase